MGLLTLSAAAWAKDYKSGEFETRRQYGFGAFEARIRAAKGPAVISTFFLWRPGSEQAPAVPWHEIDFEMGQASADYQTQIMTPGTSLPLFRTEHVAVHTLPTRPWEAYYTYRIEWTPDYIAFFVDGQEVRRETSQTEFASLFDKDASGHTPVNERMELRTGLWPGLPNIASWAGNFDGSSVPTGHFVDYVKVWEYTPDQTNKFATLLLDDEFDTLNGSNWYPAQWTFEFSASDYVPQNIGTKNGRLVVALTTPAGQGILPDPPADGAAAGGACAMSCDDGNPCTTDSCDPVRGCLSQANALGCADDGNPCTNDVCAAGACTHPNNTAPCADDGNACTRDICSAGACTHPATGTCGAGTSTPCAGLCGSPITYRASNFSSGNLGTRATCHETTASLNGGVCGNLAGGRKLTVNGAPVPCTGNWPSPLPGKRNGGYCIQTTAGDYPWAYFVTW